MRRAVPRMVICWGIEKAQNTIDDASTPADAMLDLALLQIEAVRAAPEASSSDDASARFYNRY